MNQREIKDHLLNPPDDQGDDDEFASKDFLDQNLQIDKAIRRLDDEKLSNCCMIFYRLWLLFCAGYMLGPMIILLPVGSREWNGMKDEFGDLWPYTAFFGLFGNAITMTLSCILVWVAACTKSCGIIDKAILMLQLNIFFVSIGAILMLKSYFELVPTEIQNPIQVFKMFAAPFVVLLTLVPATDMRKILKKRKMLSDVSSFDAIRGSLDPSLIDWEVQKLDKELSKCLMTCYRVWLILLWIPAFYLMVLILRALDSQFQDLWFSLAILATGITSIVFGILVWMAVRQKSLAKIEKAILIFVVNLVNVSLATIWMVVNNLKNPFRNRFANFLAFVPAVLLLLHLLPAIHIKNILQKRKRLTDMAEAAKSNSQSN